MCLSKSQNNHNRLFAVAEPLGEEFCKDIEDRKISVKDDAKKLQQTLKDNYDWDPNDCKKVWCFGPDETGPNVVVDQTKGIQHMNEISDHCQAAFQEVALQGMLAQEGMRGIRVNIVDCKLHADSIHRGGG